MPLLVLFESAILLHHAFYGSTMALFPAKHIEKTSQMEQQFSQKNVRSQIRHPKVCIISFIGFRCG